MAEAPQMIIAPPRIRGGIAAFVLVGLALVVGAFAAAGAAEGSEAAGGFMRFFLTLGTGLTALGFLIRLFGLIELRLIDIHRTVSAGLVAVSNAAVAEPSP